MELGKASWMPGSRCESGNHGGVGYTPVNIFAGPFCCQGEDGVQEILGGRDG